MDEESEDEDDRTEVGEGANAGAVKREMIDIQESQKQEWEEMAKEVSEGGSVTSQPSTLHHAMSEANRERGCICGHLWAFVG